MILTITLKVTHCLWALSAFLVNLERLELGQLIKLDHV